MFYEYLKISYLDLIINREIFITKFSLKNILLVTKKNKIILRKKI